MPVNKSGKQQRPIWSPTCGEECRRDDEDDVPRPEGAGEVVLEEQVGVGEHVVHDELHVEGLVLDCLVRGLKGTSEKKHSRGYMEGVYILRGPLLCSQGTSVIADVFPRNFIVPHLLFTG